MTLKAIAISALVGITALTSTACGSSQSSREARNADTRAQWNQMRQADAASRQGRSEWHRATTDFCVSTANARAFTRRADWGLGGWPARLQTWDPMKTVILNGKSENAFGVKVPFTIECKWTANGPVLVEINQ